jgi:8-oxo-dGTP pyrophosphatase MutT (NUDIX family)
MYINLADHGVEVSEFRGSIVIPVIDGWTIQRAELKFDDRFVAVVDVTYRLPDGSLDQKTLVLRRPAAAVLVLRQGERDEVLVIRQLRHGIGEPHMELPGGMGKAGEEPVVVVQRELDEEGAIRPALEDFQSWGVVHRDAARSVGLDVRLFFVRVDGHTPTTTPIAELGEHIIGRQWVSLDWLLREMREDRLTDPILMTALGKLLLKSQADLV